MEQTILSIPKATPSEQALNRAIDDAYRRGDDLQVNALLVSKLILARQAAGPAQDGA